MAIEEKLAKYRRQKQRQETTNLFKNLLWWKRTEAEKFKPMTDKKMERYQWQEKVDDGAKNSSDESLMSEDSVITMTTRAESVHSDNDMLVSQNSMLTNFIYLLYALLWVTLYGIALEYEFGAVYFVLSALMFIYVNTRSGPKRQGELSAYSVFNPNCEAIDGTLDASQFENEIKYGIGGML